MTFDAAAAIGDRDRCITLEGAFNLRDIGGYQNVDGSRVRWRRVLRADAPERLTFADRARLAALSIGTVIDLRNSGEGGPGAWPISSAGRRFSLPLFDIVPEEGPLPRVIDALDLATRYLYRLETASQQLNTAVTLIAERDDAPALFHCAAGKDRTGILAAALLQMLGVPDSTIVDDYALSDTGHRRKIEAVSAAPLPFDADYSTFPEILKGAEGQVMAEFLRLTAAKHGSVATFLTTCGLPASVPERLRTYLLER